MAITAVKSSISPLATPSWPATSAMLASALALTGISVDMRWNASPMASSSAAVRSLVLSTPAMALSNAIAASALAFMPSYSCLTSTTSPVAASTACALWMAPVMLVPMSSAARAASSWLAFSSSISLSRRLLSPARSLVLMPALSSAASMVSSFSVWFFRDSLVRSIWFCLAISLFFIPAELSPVSVISLWILSYCCCSIFSFWRVASTAPCCFL